jgi:hypothetical protein
MLRGLPQAVDTDSVRQAFVHDAVVIKEAGRDVRARSRRIAPTRSALKTWLPKPAD